MQKNYGFDYANWKGWSSDQFGYLSKSQRKYYGAEIARFVKFPQSGIRVLDIGFGSGDFLTFAGEQGWRITGTELNGGLLQLAKSHGFDVHDGANLNIFEESSFDLVVAFDVLEHIPNNEMISFLSSIQRVLKPGGVFLARFPNGDSPFGLMNQNGDVTHVNFLGRGKIDFYISHINYLDFFLGGQAELVWGVNPIGCLRRLIIFSLKWSINQLVFFMFGKTRCFCSENMVLFLRIDKLI